MYLADTSIKHGHRLVFVCTGHIFEATPKGYDSIIKIFENVQVHPVGIVMTYKM